MESQVAATKKSLDGFVDVRDPYSGALLFRYDDRRKLVQIRRRGKTVLVDLTRYAMDRKYVKRAG